MFIFCVDSIARPKRKGGKNGENDKCEKKDRPKFHKGDKVVWFINLLIKLKKL